jgi:Zn-dependent protease
VGTIIVPMLMLLMTNFIFGWAKPVPVDPRNMRHPRRDEAIVALAGPASNLLMALLWGGIARLGLWASMQGNDWVGVPITYMGTAGIMINVVLGVLNLIPLPPLDGGRVLSSLLPRRSAYYLSRLEPYSFLILILLLVSGVLSSIIAPAVFFIINLIGNLFGLS